MILASIIAIAAFVFVFWWGFNTGHKYGYSQGYKVGCINSIHIERHLNKMDEAIQKVTAIEEKLKLKQQ
ncbi:MAG: hypothetical protein AMXMBFR84_37670 [Candidatus Hydrogenedentota bacterium]